MDAARARRHLLRVLQLAHAGEWGATRAYLGHRAALPPGPDRAGITDILKDEIRHRRGVFAMLAALGGAPDARLERIMDRIGRTIAFVCHVGGWFVPMYGAARLERDNIGEYEVAARLAWFAGAAELVDELLHWAEVEWDHERWLRERAATHWMWRWFPTWPPPPPRAAIRSRFAAFTLRPEPIERRKHLLGALVR